MRKDKMYWMRAISVAFAVGLMMQGVLLVLPKEASAYQLVLQPSDWDTTVVQDYPTTNYGSSSQGTIKSGQMSNSRFLLKFDISSLPPGYKITQAVLQLEGVTAVPCEDFDLPKNVHAYRARTYWGEHSATWDKEPDYAAEPSGEAPDVTSPTLYVTITELVREWYDGTHDNYGFMLRMVHEGGDNEGDFCAAHFNTRELESPPGGEKPKLTIGYEDPGDYLGIQVVEPQNDAELSRECDCPTLKSIVDYVGDVGDIDYVVYSFTIGVFDVTIPATYEYDTDTWVAELDCSRLPDGDYEITARVVLVSLHSATDSILVHVLYVPYAGTPDPYVDIQIVQPQHEAELPNDCDCPTLKSTVDYVGTLDYVQYSFSIGTYDVILPAYYEYHTDVWVAELDCSRLPVGAYTITAEASINSGAFKNSDSISVSVVYIPYEGAPGPYVDITIVQPQNNAELPNDCDCPMLKARVDYVGTLDYVQYSFSIGTYDVILPAYYEYHTDVWVAELDCSRLPVGAYTITAEASINSGAFENSDSISVSVVYIPYGDGIDSVSITIMEPQPGDIVNNTCDCPVFKSEVVKTGVYAGAPVDYVKYHIQGPGVSGPFPFDRWLGARYDYHEDLWFYELPCGLLSNGLYHVEVETQVSGQIRSDGPFSFSILNPWDTDRRVQVSYGWLNEPTPATPGYEYAKVYDWNGRQLLYELEIELSRHPKCSAPPISISVGYPYHWEIVEVGGSPITNHQYATVTVFDRVTFWEAIIQGTEPAPPDQPLLMDYTVYKLWFLVENPWYQDP